jgi:tetratricopeptide (TPR) repeat protein
MQTSSSPIAPPSSPRRTLIAWLAPILCAVAILIAYSNTPGNSFQLDDWHTIQDNPWVRSLSNIPAYFRDAKTHSVLAANVDYRPIIQVTYAIDYAISGYDITDRMDDAWHWTNIIIHFICSWCVFLLGRRLFGTLGLAPVPGLPPAIGDAVSLAAAVLFAIHPMTAGPVNYISARSSTLTSMFVLPSLIWYLRGLARPARWWRFVISGSLFALGMLTKVEAISLLAAVILAEFLLNPELQPLPLFKRLAQWQVYPRLGAFCLLGLALLVLWHSKTTLTNSSTRAGVEASDYFLTQFRAWWYYIGHIFAPLNLIADYPTYPLSKSIFEPRVLLALSGWALVLALAALTMRKAPVVTFLIICFFACLAPHSSIVPLAEPVNEHRPYLPATAVFLLFAIGAGLALVHLTIRPRLAAFIIVAILSGPFILLTRDRNRVWHDAYTLWGDNVQKTPDSTRVQMNYGLELMKRGQYPEAEARFRESLRLAPNYHYAYTNLAITLAARGDTAGALAAHDSAVRSAPNSDAPYFWRARFRAELHDVPGAAEDFEKAIQFGSAPFRELAGAAECLLRLGRTADAEKYVQQGRALDTSKDGADFETLRKNIRDLLGTTDVEALMNEGSAYMSKNDLIRAEWRFREALRIDPGNARGQVNLGLILAAQGNPQAGQQILDQAVNQHPTSDMPRYWRGRFFASLKNWDAALTDFHEARKLGPSPIRDTAAIAETLLAAGRNDEANTELAKTDPANAVLAAARAEFKAQVFKAK